MTTLFRFSLAIAASLVLALSPGVAWAQAPAEPFPNAVQAGATRPQVSSAPLVRAGGAPFSLDELKGKWVWLYLGFANCPGACPMAMTYLKEEYQRLKAPEQVEVVFVSLDPARDTPESLATYAGYFNPAFKGVTGERQSLDALARSLNVTYTIPPGAKPTDNYSVGHPNFIFALDPEGRLAAVYEPNFDGKAGSLATDFNSLPASAAQAPEPSGDAAPPPLPTTGLAWCGLGPESADMAADPLMLRARTQGSGTSVLPAVSPMRMWGLRAGDWMWMLHGDGVVGANAQGGTRGALTWAAENWAMLHGSRFWGPGILDLRTMMSLEALTLPPGGTPQLFQFGETYQFQPLVDRQHPHDLVMELAARYTWNLDTRTGFFAYGGPAGEPALGPSAFMHRPSSADNHWAPLAHHLQDGSHIAYGVATVGARRDDFQLEASLFNGREPDENRFDFDFGPLDSWATRLSWFPGRNWALQTSYGQLKNPEILFPGDVHRTTASATHVVDTSFGAWSTMFAWGQNRELHQNPVVLQSYLLESQLDLQQVNHLYGRYELVDKVGLIPRDSEAHRVNALTLGWSRDLGPVDRYALGIGGDVTVYSMDKELTAVYGYNPLSFRVYLRLRPPTMAPVAAPAQP